MMKRISILVLVLLLSAGAAQACDCPELPPDQVARASTLFFVGQTQIPREVVPKGGASFANSLIWKGARLTTPIIAGNAPEGDASCAAEFFLSETYYIMAYGSYESGYYTDKCALSRVNGESANRDKVMFFLSHHYMKIESFLQENGFGDMQNLTWLRKVAKFYLDEYSPEQAQRYYRHAAIVSRESILDLEGEGEAYLQMGMARQALNRFDDVLEKNNTDPEAWSGRYRALALMGRWDELPGDKPNLAGMVWRQAKLSADLSSPNLTRSWWTQIDAAGRKLTGADFSKSELSVVSFKGADLTGVNFSKSRLFDVDFTGATLKDARFDGASLENVKWPEGFTPPASTPWMGVPKDIPVAETPASLPMPSIGQQDPAGR